MQATSSTTTVEAFSKTSTSTATNDSGHPPPSKPNENSLLSGSYDEKESSASFQTALAEWREAGKTTSTTQAYPTKGIPYTIPGIMVIHWCMELAS
jgi:hypothetical protein